MRYPSAHKEKTREKILATASRLFREKGYNGVGVDALMAEAGLTAGGFYSHFPSKEALFSEAIAHTLQARISELKPDRPDQPSATGLQSVIKAYLSRTHRDMAADGCPLPSLTPDVIRGSESVRTDYERMMLKVLETIESRMPGDIAEKRPRALAVLAQLVGGLMLARAVNDDGLSDQILKACRQAAIGICDQEG